MSWRRARARSAALREALLDAWAAGGNGPEVADAHGVTQGHLGCLLHRARRAGDPRAAYRLHVAGLKRPRKPGPTPALREAVLDAWVADLRKDGRFRVRLVRTRPGEHREQTLVTRQGLVWLSHRWAAKLAVDAREAAAARI